MFQAALVSIHNAKSDNQSVQQQGIHNLTQCAGLHAQEGVSSSRVAGLLRKLATRYSVFGPQHSNDVIAFCPNHVALESVATTSSSTTPSTTTTDNASTQNNEPSNTDIQGTFLENGQDTTMSPTSLLNNELQFDLASLTSDVPLWNAPSGVTWTDWDPFLQEPSL